MSRAEDVIAEAVHGSGDIACRCKPGDEWWCADRREGLVYEREQATAVIEAIRNLSPDDLAELIDGKVEWGVSHSQGRRPEPSEKSARGSLVWMTERYEQSARNTFKPRVESRVVGPWQETP